MIENNFDIELFLHLEWFKINIFRVDGSSSSLCFCFYCV